VLIVLFVIAVVFVLIVAFLAVVPFIGISNLAGSPAGSAVYFDDATTSTLRTCAVDSAATTTSTTWVCHLV
jgi:hypothetical protein